MQILPKDHTILEKGTMEFRPFGKNEQGEKIRDVTGIKVHAYVTHLEEILARKEGAQAGRQASEKLCSLLNDRIPDPTYHVYPNVFKEYLEQLFIRIRVLFNRILPVNFPRSAISGPGWKNKIHFTHYSNTGSAILSPTNL